MSHLHISYLILALTTFETIIIEERSHLQTDKVLWDLWCLIQQSKPIRRTERRSNSEEEREGWIKKCSVVLGLFRHAAVSPWTAFVGNDLWILMKMELCWDLRWWRVPGDTEGNRRREISRSHSGVNFIFYRRVSPRMSPVLPHPHTECQVR